MYSILYHKWAGCVSSLSVGVLLAGKTVHDLLFPLIAIMFGIVVRTDYSCSSVNSTTMPFKLWLHQITAQLPENVSLNPPSNEL